MDSEREIRELRTQLDSLKGEIGQLTEKFTKLSNNYTNHQHGGSDDSAKLYNYPINLKPGSTIGIGDFTMSDEDTGDDKTLFTDTDGSLTWRDTNGYEKVLGGPFLSVGPQVSTITISGGSITPTQGFHEVDTESGAASDDLDTIVVTGIPDGSLLVLQAESSSRDVVLKDGTGNLRLGGDFTMNHAEDVILLLKVGTVWYEVASNSNNT